MRLLRISRRFFALLAFVLLLALTAALFPQTASAASTSLSISNATAYVGKSFTVNITSSTSNISGFKLNLTYDTDILQFDNKDENVKDTQGMPVFTHSSENGSIHLEGAYGKDPPTGKIAVQITFKALKQGTAAIRFAVCEILDSDVNAVDTSLNNSSVTVLVPSSDATLKSLSTGSGKLSPAFSAQTTSYTLAVENSVSKLAVSAVSNDSSAKVAVSGNSRLSVGKNTVTIKVTAGDGSVKTYTIAVTRAEGATASSTTPATEPTGSPAPTVTLTDGSELPVTSFSDDQIPKGFSRTSVAYGGQETAAIVYGSSPPLVYLAGDGSHSAGFYYLNAESGTVTPLIALSVPAGSYFLSPPGADAVVPLGYKAATVEINGTDAEVYAPEGTADPDHYLLYAVSAAGKLSLYRYDLSDGTLQRYAAPLEDGSADDASSDVFLLEGILPAGSLLPLLAGTAVVFFFTTVLFGVLLIVKSHRLRVLKDREEDSVVSLPTANHIADMLPVQPAVNPTAQAEVSSKPVVPPASAPTDFLRSPFDLDDILQEYSDKHPKNDRKT